MNSKEIYKMYKQIEQITNQLLDNGYIYAYNSSKDFKECLYQIFKDKCAEEKVEELNTED